MKNSKKILKFKLFDKKKEKPILENIILTSSDGFDLPLLHYSQLGLGNLILTYLYALYIKLNYKNLKIIPFYPLRIIPIIKDFKYWYLRSSFEFNYKISHFKRLLNFFILKKKHIQSFIIDKDLYLSTDIINKDNSTFKKISNLKLNYIKKNIVSILNFDYQIKKFNKLDLINNKDNIITLGLHLRRGDFMHKNRKDGIRSINASVHPNTSPDIDTQIKIILKIKSKIKLINIYSDQSHLKTMKELSNKLDNFRLNFFPVNANGSKVLQDMMKNDVIVLSNSTLSLTSCMLSNQLALFNNQLVPNRLKKYYKNIKEVKL
jgi:hypothetical protein